MESDFEIIPSRAPSHPPLNAIALREAAELLKGASKPLLLAGGGVSGSDANAELAELAELLDIPVAVADGGKGAIPDDHPLALGTALGQRIWGDNPVQDYVGTCDVVLVVGSSLPYRTTTGVQMALPENLIQVDIDPGMFGRNYPIKVGLAGDAKHVLRQLIIAVGDAMPNPARRYEAVALRRKTREGLEFQMPNELRLWEGIRDAIGRDAVVMCDSTVSASAGMRCLPVFEPRSVHGPHGWVSIGYSFAASLGAKVGVPDRQVLCVTGDGGFQYNLQELGSAVQHGIAPIVLVFNDNAWGVLKGYQHTRMDDRYFATDLSNPDFKTLAAAYGIDYAHVRGTDELTSTLKRIGKPSKITLVEASVPDGTANFT
jgi:acetolactate synthase-1/2/3 large subunit